MNVPPLRCLALAVFLVAAGRASAQIASQLYTEGAQTYEAGNTDAAK